MRKSYYLLGLGKVYAHSYIYHISCSVKVNVLGVALEYGRVNASMTWLGKVFFLGTTW